MNHYLKAYLKYGPELALRIVGKALLGKKRGTTPEQNYAIYNPMRQKLLEDFEKSPPTVDRYVCGSDAGQRASLGLTDCADMMLDGKATANSEAVADRYFSDLVNEIERYDPKSVTEIGSGYGRNIIGLAARNPSRDYLGLELTPASVELSRKAADHYGLRCEFREFDATKEWDGHPMADVVFSVHALEAIPDSSAVVDRMVAHARKAVIMFEPFPDYWRGMKGVARKLKALRAERLTTGSLRNHSPSVVKPLDYSSHVLNTPTLVIIEKA